MKKKRLPPIKRTCMSGFEPWGKTEGCTKDGIPSCKKLNCGSDGFRSTVATPDKNEEEEKRIE
eukprot:CAMPEP_0204889400 /NCGR_PEP_ID=MMETSP1349-20130617/22450_1 /ASSEMBLY_ACC=CAM_ASM_000710 /TAXON_ID=215587 /ORGANISM="Aplanochytrium stocchinoi, Strain GSBS06" /LENGTH=62 /DNA_ID=CAMNT_0052053405 /DNA_START=118 /DNA_END=303 /DNA_ORIENTATION=-